jgi:hypothetical protein
MGTFTPETLRARRTHARVAPRHAQGGGGHSGSHDGLGVGVGDSVGVGLAVGVGLIGGEGLAAGVGVAASVGVGVGTGVGSGAGGAGPTTTGGGPTIGATGDGGCGSWLGVAPGVRLAVRLGEAVPSGGSGDADAGEPLPPRMPPRGLGDASLAGAAEGGRISVPLAAIPTTAASRTTVALALMRNSHNGRPAPAAASHGVDGSGADEKSMSVIASLAPASRRHVGHADAWMATSRAGSSRAPAISHAANASWSTLTSGADGRSPGYGVPSARRAPRLELRRRRLGNTAHGRVEGGSRAPVRRGIRSMRRRADRTARYP